MPAPFSSWSTRSSQLPIRSAVVLVAAWAALLAGGFTTLETYNHTPGSSGAAPSEWPGDPSSASADSRFTLLMLAHPMCPCTRASMAELERLVAKVQDRVDVQVAFLAPPAVPGPETSDQAEDWADSELVKQARRIPGVHVRRDPEGRLARKFGAETSGHVVLYGPAGDLLFEGGLTSSRGHEGQSKGVLAIQQHVQLLPEAAHRAETFGCELEDPH